MNSNIDFVTRAHALWRVRMAHWQQRFRFFSTITLGAAATGAIIAPQFLLHGPAITTAVQYAWANVLTLLGSLGGSDIKINIAMEGQRWTVSAAWFASEPLFTDTFWQVVKVIAGGATTGFAIGLFTVWVLQRTMSAQGKDTLADRVIGGTRVVDEEDVAAQTTLLCGRDTLRIGPVPVPRRIETRHFAFLGTTGSGKTTALRQMLDGIERRGEAALVYDTSGEFIAHYYNPARGDIILNPFDARCAFWTPFDEISHPADADRIARQLVSETSSQDDDVWLETSRILVANMIRSLWAEKNCSLEALLEALQVKDKEQLKEWLGHTSSARTFANDADRATGSVLFMLAKAANLIQFLKVEDEGEERFAFRDFIAKLDKCEGAKPWIFVPRKEDYFEASKPLMACWLECAASAVLGLSPSPDRRIWFVLDELADLPRVENLARLLPEGRKFGAAIVLTFQALGQMRNRYGANIAEAMLACCNTKLFLQTVDQETRKWASETIGQCEVELRVATDTLSIGSEVPRTTIATQRQFRPAVLESELRLSPHQGYLLLPDGLPVARIGLTADHITRRGDPRQPAYVPGDPAGTLWSRVSEIVKGAEPDAKPGPV
ncbi:type IV secretion system DNA-binding domain-containing protein [Croceicoccus marinus]|jgi:type IV secretory pathway TraG/TraD family ATPase VirD4|uniref:Conjugal transfer protein TraD n=1 Tax=Croceicoccus marinus TaxID=450378 RepID=A0A1Z1F8G1_9SPHN|nr:type IV secretion system DNA-binding domain-containing protein [Croceicoccus marinus]ARU15091.1 conjugal transfer protein TraD [Croceicoccus marinus]|tara:strand:- start:15248 stop:17068 length:1821 start_codon:yes stop_codon:yes gene_type:complete